MVSCFASAVIHAAAFSLTVDYPLFQPSMNPYKAPIYLEERARPLEVTPKTTVQKGKNIKKTPRESKRPSGAVARKETSPRGQRRGRPSGDAHISGGEETVLLDTREPRYAPYLTRIRHRIEEFWNYPEFAKEFGIEGDATLRFSILGDGTISSLLLITSSGFEALDEESLRAVRIADPYPPLPDRLGLTKLTIIATFQYRIRPSFLPET
jgi:TonB family protein